MNNRLIKVSCFCIFLVLILLVRVPFLKQTLIGEEGTHTMFVVGYESKNAYVLGDSEKYPVIINHCYAVTGRINEHDIIQPSSRNIVPYCILGLGIQPLAQLVDLSKLTFTEKSQFARSLFLLISSVGILSLLLICYFAADGLPKKLMPLPFAILFYFTSNQLLIGSSIQPQLDGAFGFLLLGTSSLLLYLASTQQTTLLRKIFLAFIVGTISAFCKNEWTLTLIGSAFSLLILRSALVKVKIIETSSADKGINFIYLSLILGSIFGMGLCYLASPQDYIDGFRLMGALSSVDPYTSFIKTIQNPMLRPALASLFVGLLLIGINFKPLIKDQSLVLLVYIWGFSILLGYLQSGHTGDGFLRYYVPTVILCTSVIITLIPRTYLLIKGLPGIIIIAPALVIASFISFYTLLQGMRWEGTSITVPMSPIKVKEKILEANSVSSNDKDAVFLTHSSIRYYFPGVNFIAKDVGYSGADGLIERFKPLNPKIHLVEMQ